MKQKNVLYKKEQENILEDIINILNLDADNSTTLYELDTNIIKQKKILDLIPVIRKYFTTKNIIGAKEPEQCKRPYLSIIKNIVKIKYNVYHSDWRIDIDSKKIRTTKYIFIKK